MKLDEIIAALGGGAMQRGTPREPRTPNACTSAIREFGLRRTVFTTNERASIVRAMRLKWETP